MITFAHLADCHIGGWRDPRLKDAAMHAFREAVSTCLHEKVSFVIIAGDFFNTAVPPIDHLKTAVTELQRLKDAEIPVYIVTGSHDYSASGKTFIDVLEEARLCINISRPWLNEDTNKIELPFIIDKKTGVAITGIGGRRQSLERNIYTSLNKEPLEAYQGKKIFVFHSALTELRHERGEILQSQPLSFLPRGFDYYAGGHVHVRAQYTLPGYPLISYSGPLFPNSFSELEELEHGGFNIVTLTDQGTSARYHPIKLYPLTRITIDVNGMSSAGATHAAVQKIKESAQGGSVITLRIAGTLSSGSTADIDYHAIYEAAERAGAHTLLRNTSMLMSTELLAHQQATNQNPNNIEREAIENHNVSDALPTALHHSEKELIKTLISTLSCEKNEGETTTDFEKRIIQEFISLLSLH